jgi:hypothetical protein
MVGADTGILKTIELYPTLTLIQKDINEKLSVAIVNSKIINLDELLDELFIILDAQIWSLL